MPGSERVMSGHSNHPEDNGGEYSRRRLTQWVLVAITAFGIVLCGLLAKPFLDAITWALGLAVAGRPLHRRLEHLGPNTAALIAVIVVTITLVAPGVFLIQNLFEETRSWLATIGKTFHPGAIHSAVAGHPLAERALAWLESSFDQDDQVRRLTGALAGQLPGAVIGSSQFITQFAIMLVTLFYFLRDHRQLMGALAGLMPLSQSEASMVIRRISETIRATLYGNLAVKFIQGVLGGLMFWVLGLPAPALFGALMALLAVLPMVGTAFVWGPAAIYLLLQGSWVKAVILLAWGGLVVSTIDNLLYPMLVAGEVRIHTLAILFAVFGGLIRFGLAGIILGPLILAVTLSLLDVWRRRTEVVRIPPEYETS